MVMLCLTCWQETNSDKQNCPNCGSEIDSDSPFFYDRLLIWALKNPRPERRAQVCKILSLRGAKSAIPYLLDMLSDPTIVVQVAALRALGALGDYAVVPQLEKALASQSLLVRVAAIDALRDMGVDTYQRSLNDRQSS